MLDMRRRDFIGVLGAAAAWPIAGRAQQRIPVIGILGAGSAEPFAQVEAGFREGLKEGGFVIGSNAGFESRWANGQVDRLPGLAADVIGHNANVIATMTL